jgi:hypothetical protein
MPLATWLTNSLDRSGASADARRWSRIDVYRSMSGAGSEYWLLVWSSMYRRSPGRRSSRTMPGMRCMNATSESRHALPRGSLPRPGEIALLTAISAVLDFRLTICPDGSRWSGVTSEQRSRRCPAPAASRSRWSRGCSSATPAATDDPRRGAGLGRPAPLELAKAHAAVVNLPRRVAR